MLEKEGLLKRLANYFEKDSQAHPNTDLWLLQYGGHGEGSATGKPWSGDLCVAENGRVGFDEVLEV